MFIPEILETGDKSYYTDRIAAMTGKPRSYWGQFPIEEIRQIYRETLRRVLTLQTTKGANHENAHYQKTG